MPHYARFSLMFKLFLQIRTFIFLVTVQVFTEPLGTAFQIDNIHLDVVYQPGDTQQLSQIEKLLQAQNWNQAATVVDDLLSKQIKSTVPFPMDSRSRESVLTAPNVREHAQWYLSQRFAQYPDALQAYREYVATVAASQFPDARQSIEKLEQFVGRFAFSNSGPEALMTLGDYYYRNGQLRLARRSWNRLLTEENQTVQDDDIIQIRRDAFSMEWTVPNESIDQAAVHARLLCLELASGNKVDLQTKLDRFKTRWPDATFDLNGKTVQWLNWLENQFKQPANTPGDPNQPETNGASIIDVTMEEIWRATIESPWPEMTERISTVCLPAGRSSSLRQRIRPVVYGDQVIWNDGNRVRSINIDDGKPSFPTGVQWDSDDDRKGTIWRISREIDVQSSKSVGQIVGVPEFDVTTLESNIYARVGSPFISSQPDAPQSRSLLIGLSQLREGRLIPGFPLQTPGPDYEFLGCPVVDTSGIYVALQKAVGTQIEIYIAHYDGKITNSDEPPIPRWITFVARGETYGQFCDGNISRNVISDVGNAIIIGGMLGTIGRISKSNGHIDWLIRYPRQPLVGNKPEHQMLNYFRSAGPYTNQANSITHLTNQVLILPTDHPDVFCVEITSGRVLWQNELPDVMYVLGEDDEHYYMSGDRLYWIERKTGSIVTSYPGYHGTIALGDARNSPRGLGKGTVTTSKIAVPMDDHILLFDRTLAYDPRFDSKVPVIARRINWDQQANPISEIRFTKGKLLVIDDKKIVAFK